MLVALFIVGFPSLYGGAGAELYHQVRVWEALGLRLHFIPTPKNVRKAALHVKMTERGHVIHDACDWAGIPEAAPVISFCNEDFLAALPEIRRRTRRTVLVNCMTCLFGKEKEAMSRGDIALFLYQNDQIRQSVMPHLRVLNGDPSIRFMTFRPYFDSSAFPHVADRPADWFGAGHISRQDEDKFSKDTWRIYEHFASPVPKRGTFLVAAGYLQRLETDGYGKTGLKIIFS